MCTHRVAPRSGEGPSRKIELGFSGVAGGRVMGGRSGPPCGSSACWGGRSGCVRAGEPCRRWRHVAGVEPPLAGLWPDGGGWFPRAYAAGLIFGPPPLGALFVGAWARWNESRGDTDCCRTDNGSVRRGFSIALSGLPTQEVRYLGFRLAASPRLTSNAASRLASGVGCWSEVAGLAPRARTSGWRLGRAALPAGG